MSQPFYQPARQNFSSSQNMQQPQGFGGGQGFGGFQQQSWGGGFGGFGGGFQPQGFGFGGGFGGFGGGFQPQQQFNPYQGGFGGFGGFGGGFNPYQGGFGGFGGGYNPMFGGIGGLGFNPMMGQNFGMPMQGIGDPRVDTNFGKQPSTQEEWAYANRNAIDSPFATRLGMPMQGFGGMGAAAAQAQRTPIQFDEKMPTEQDWNLHAASAFYAPNTDMEAMKRDFMSRPMRTPRNLEALFGQSTADQPRQPLYGGIGGLGFNPMMGPQFGMPMQTQYGNTTAPPPMRQYPAELESEWQQRLQTMNTARMSPTELESAKQRWMDTTRRFDPRFGGTRPDVPEQMTQGGVPMAQLQAMLQGQQSLVPTEDWQQQQIRQYGRLHYNPYTGAQY